MAATGVGGLGGSPPTPQAVDGELRGIGRPSHADMSAIATNIVQAVGDRAALGVLREVVRVDLFRRSAPGRAVVGEVPHEFLVLRVDAQHRTALAQGQVPQSPQVAELPVTVGRRLATEPFVIGSQPVVGCATDAAARWDRRVGRVARPASANCDGPTSATLRWAKLPSPARRP